jgi:hypothetical protein
MKSSARGKTISEAEIQDITPHGLWLWVNGKEYLLPFTDFPWFKTAKVSDIYQLQLLHGSHLYWPRLDIDLAVESLESPEKYPLVFSAK